MTINATALWILALYQVVAEEQGADLAALSGTTQNDIVKEYLSRGTYVFPPAPVDAAGDRPHGLHASTTLPRWNPVNVCSYHLQEAGATPVQEVAYALATAVALLDAVHDGGQVAPEALGDVVGRISFFVDAGVRFVEEMCKLRAFADLWDELTRERYGVTDERQRRFRYGVQVNSLGLTAAQPENNVARIMLELLAVTLSKRARARAVQLPAWNEALGLPRPWDQQWSLRLQQVLAYESDLLEHEDLFEGSAVVGALTAQIADAARAELTRIEERGGVVAAVESGELKAALVAAHAERRRRIETGEMVVVGVNRFTETEPSPLTADLGTAVERVDPRAEADAVAAVRAWRERRDARPEVRAAAASALARLRADAAGSANLMPATLECARAGVTTGEWAGALRQVFGEYRAPTGLGGAAVGAESGAESGAAVGAGHAGSSRELARAAVRRTAAELGGRLRLLVGKPGLDGHSNGAEQVALAARDAGFEVVYAGIRQTPAQLVAAAVAEDVHCVGVSVLSGAHLELVPAVVDGLREQGAGDVPVVVGGVVPPDDVAELLGRGAAAVFTPADHDLGLVLARVVDVVRVSRGLPPFGPRDVTSPGGSPAAPGPRRGSAPVP